MIERLIRLPRTPRVRALPKVSSGVTRVSSVLAALGLVAAVSASCSDLTGLDASYATIADSGVVYAINGAPPGAPTALYLYSGTLLAADANFIFDVAFDLNESGGVTILPQSVVASSLATKHSVGLQKSTLPYDEITSAPKSGFHADTAVVVGVNEPVIAQSVDANVCGVSLTGTTIHAKIVVKSIDPTTRSMMIYYTVDPNCGFRSFASGVPKD